MNELHFVQDCVVVDRDGEALVRGTGADGHYYTLPNGGRYNRKTAADIVMQVRANNFTVLKELWTDEGEIPALCVEDRIAVSAYHSF